MPILPFDQHTGVYQCSKAISQQPARRRVLPMPDSGRPLAAAWDAFLAARVRRWGEAVPYAVTRRLASRLDAGFVTVERGGHFLGREGFTEFPLVYEHLSAMMRAADEPGRAAPAARCDRPEGK